MSQFANVTGLVHYAAGDGPLLEIPKGQIEIDLAPDSATLSWEAADGVVGLAAIPRTTFEEYLQDGKIVLSK